MDKSPITGLFFHSFRTVFSDNHFVGPEVVLEWQGQVVSQIESSAYLVQLFDWVSGNPSEKRVVMLGAMSGWSFYDSADSMKEAHKASQQMPARPV